MVKTKTLDEIQGIVDALDYDFDCFSLNHFIKHIEWLRNRKIVVVGWEFEPKLYALWVPKSSTDYIFFNHTLHSTHQTHSILHELAHMLLGHACSPLDQVLPPHMLAELKLGSQQQGRPRTVLLNELDPTQEEESEMFVYLIQKKVVNARRIHELYRGSSTVEVFKPYADGMGFED